MDDQYPPYVAYENSDIEACPRRPSHWGTTRVKFLSELNPSKSQVEQLDPLTPITFLPMEAIGENGELDVSRERLLRDVKSGYTFLGEGDVCIAKITPCFENGKGAIVSGTRDGVAFATTEVIPFRPNRREDGRFLYYLLTSDPFKSNGEASMYGAGGQKRVADSFAGNYLVVLPPPFERSQIASFLDHETAKIDALIEKQQQLIALLQEKRQAVISHAVTKGLNPDAPMRDSGVEWLGEVPAHWGVARLKHHVRQIVDGTHFTPTYIGDSGVPFLRVLDIQSFPINRSTVKYIPEAEHRELVRRCHPELGDLLISKNGSIGLPRVIDWDWKFSIFVSLCLIKVKEALDVRFLYFFFLTHQAREQMFGLVKQSTVMNLHLDKIEKFWLPVPSLVEQVRIAEYLEQTIGRYDSQIEHAESIVSLLRERRAALISAAVTGKIDVRNWQPPEPQPTSQPSAEVA